MTALRVLGYAWSLPIGVLGLIGAAVFAALGWVDGSAWRTGALELVCRGPVAERLRKRNWLGFTLGWTIFYWGEPSTSIRVHEHQHVRQGMTFGVFYPLLYLVALVTVGYRDNPFEVDARRVAARKLGQPPNQS